MKKFLAINGSYRDGGVTDQAIAIMAEQLAGAGAEVEIINLRDYPIGFCFNCRECTQKPGQQPGVCVQHDGMQQLVDKIEQADGYILASPTNFSSVTAVFKRFMERLVVYAYWPWGAHAPEYRKAKSPRKKAVLISSSAAPGIMGRWLFGSVRQLKITAKTIGADAVGTLFTGLVSQQPSPKLPEDANKRATALAERLL